MAGLNSLAAWFGLRHFSGPYRCGRYERRLRRNKAGRVDLKPEVKRQDQVQEFETEERCSILEVANDAGDEQVSIARATVMPGITTAWHKLTGTAERYIIVAGTGRVQIGDSKPLEVREGDVVRIPADTAQRIENTGEAGLVFYAVCSPRFRPECYVALEEQPNRES